MLRTVSLIGWFFLLLGGLLGSGYSDSFLGPWDTELRFASSLALVAAALASWRRAGSALAVVVAGSMLLGAAGDASPIWGRGWSAGHRLVTTMILFGLGHLGYLAAIWRLRPSTDDSPPSNGQRTTPWARPVPLLCSVALGIVSWYFVVVVSDKELARQLHWPSLGYSLVLSITAGGLLTLAWQLPAYRVAGLGGVLFFASDILLGLDIFQERSFHHPIDWIWICYGVGQMLIVTSLTHRDASGRAGW